MGLQNVIGVKVDSLGKIDLVELEKEIEACIARDHEPFLISATAGNKS
jgi:hypothetical protein